MIIARNERVSQVLNLLDQSPIVAILGARQVGKTTLTHEIEAVIDQDVHRFDLEDPADLARLAEPVLALSQLAGLIIIDEVQRRKDLFPILRVLVDKLGFAARFLILGSASPDLLRQSSETLAGRILYYSLPGFSTAEVGMENLERLWERGGFPRSYLAGSDSASYNWRRGFVQTFLERDIPQLGFNIPADTLYRFWGMLAHYHGQIWNGNELARAFGISHTSVRRYLDILTGTLVLWQLRPWYENISKRLVKSPKVYLCDTGLLHCLLGIRTDEELYRHPKIGASWEGFVLNEVIQVLCAEPSDCYFWATYSGAELDLMVQIGTVRLGFEVKRTSAPSLTRSMRISFEELQLNELFVIHAGEHQFMLDQNIQALPVNKIHTLQCYRWVVES